MAADDFAKILRQPGRLVLTPTDMAAAFPYGGTSLGYLREGVTLRPNPGELVCLKAQDRRRGFDYLYVGDGELILRADLLQADDDVIGLAFPGGLSTTSTTSGNRLVQLPGTLEPGAFGSDFAVKILFAPENTRRGKFALFRKCVPWLQDAAEIAAKRKHAFSFPLEFKAQVDTSATAAEGLVVIGDKRDITL